MYIAEQRHVLGHPFILDSEALPKKKRNIKGIRRTGACFFLPKHVLQWNLINVTPQRFLDFRIWSNSWRTALNTQSVLLFWFESSFDFWKFPNVPNFLRELLVLLCKGKGCSKCRCSSDPNHTEPHLRHFSLSKLFWIGRIGPKSFLAWKYQISSGTTSICENMFKEFS